MDNKKIKEYRAEIKNKHTGESVSVIIKAESTEDALIKVAEENDLKLIESNSNHGRSDNL